MLYNENQVSSTFPRRSQARVLGLPISHLVIAALGVGLLNMIANQPSQLETALFGIVMAVVYNQFKKFKRHKRSRVKINAS